MRLSKPTMKPSGSTPRIPATLYNRGVVLAELGWFEDAIEAYDETMRLDPDDPMVLRARSLALRALGQEEVAQVSAYS
jgi:lipoprotein NlpI